MASLQPLPMLLVDCEGRILLGNTPASTLLGVPPSSLPGQALGPMVAPLTVLAETSGLGSEERTPTGVEFQSEDGTTKRLTSRLVEMQLTRPGQPIASVTTLWLQDISGWDKLRTGHDRLLQLATVGELMPTVLHELKNPLASILVAVELMIEETAAESQRRDLHAILTELRRMKLGFEGLGTVGRRLNSKTPNAVDLALREVFQVLAARFRGANLVASCSVKDMPLLPLDLASLRAIAFNLLTNAIQACGLGDSVRLSAGLDASGKTFVLQVSDTGRGMNTEQRERCCKLSFATKESGNGLGLPLIRSSIEKAGGELSIESTQTPRQRRGTTITACIPIDPPSTDAS